jgi:hypothetical protein
MRVIAGDECRLDGGVAAVEFRRSSLAKSEMSVGIGGVMGKELRQSKRLQRHPVRPQLLYPVKRPAEPDLAKN